MSLSNLASRSCLGMFEVNLSLRNSHVRPVPHTMVLQAWLVITYWRLVGNKGIYCKGLYRDYIPLLPYKPPVRLTGWGG